MSLIFQDSEQRVLALPVEIWNTIASFTIDLSIIYKKASFQAFKKVLAVVSKEFNQLSKKLTNSSKPVSLLDESVVVYCCKSGYDSLLQYVLNNGAKMVDTAAVEAARSGSLACLKITADHVSLPELCLDRAASRNNLEIIQYLVEKGMRPSRKTIISAVQSGSVDLVKFFLTLVKIENYEALGYNAASSGSLEMVKFIEQFAPLQQSDLNGSADAGSIEVLKYYIEKGFVMTAETSSIAADRGNTEFLKFAISHGAPMSEKLMQTVVEGDDIELMKELRAKGCPWDATSVSVAAMYGYFEALKFLVDNGCPLETRPNEPGSFAFGGFNSGQPTTSAALNGRVDCLKYLMEHGAPWPEDIIDKSISLFNKNQYQVVTYLHSKGCPVSARTCADVAGQGDLELLKYLHENKCPWDALTCASAAGQGNIACLKYALDNGCPWDIRTMNLASRSGSMNTLQFLFEYGIPWTDGTCTHLIQRGDLEMLKYAHANGAPWTAETITNGLKTIDAGCLPCIKYALEHGCPWDKQDVLTTAIAYNFPEVVAWIQQTYK